MLYTSEVTGKSYKTVEELEAAEAEALKAKKDKEVQAAEKKARADEVKVAYENYLKVKEDSIAAIQEAEQKFITLRDKFAEDYNGYHMTYVNENGKKTVTFGELVDAIFRW